MFQFFKHKMVKSRKFFGFCPRVMSGGIQISDHSRSPFHTFKTLETYLIDRAQTHLRTRMLVRTWRGKCNLLLTEFLPWHYHHCNYNRTLMLLPKCLPTCLCINSGSCLFCIHSWSFDNTVKLLLFSCSGDLKRL